MIRIFLSNKEVLDLLEKHVVVTFDEQATIENVILVLDPDNQLEMLLELANTKKPKRIVEEATFNSSFTKEEWVLFKIALEIGVGKSTLLNLNRKERVKLLQLYSKFIDLQVSEESEI